MCNCRIKINHTATICTCSCHDRYKESLKVIRNEIKEIEKIKRLNNNVIYLNFKKEIVK